MRRNFMKIKILLMTFAVLAASLLSSCSSVSNPSSDNRTSDTTSASALTLSEKGQQIEQRILRDESLNVTDLEGLSTMELRILRNVHFARYGRKYDKGGLGDYFYSQSGYKPNDSYNENMVTATDKANISLILTVENNLNPQNITKKIESQSANTSNINTANNNLDSQSSSIPSSGNTLSQDEMLRLMRNNGIVGGMYGLYKYKEYQILRVGPFNEQMKYHPVQVRVSDLMNNGETKY